MKGKKSKASVIAGVVITIVALAFSAYIMFNSSKETEFTIDEVTKTLEISGGLYGRGIIINENVELALISPLVITNRTNGSSLGNVKSGSFTLEGGLAVYLNLGDSTMDWIEIIDGEDYYYINLKNADETIQLLSDLQGINE
jgi:hypothetical protein